LINAGAPGMKGIAGVIKRNYIILPMEYFASGKA